MIYELGMAILNSIVYAIGLIGAALAITVLMFAVIAFIGFIVGIGRRI